MPAPIYNSVHLARFAIKQALQARTTRPVRWWRAFETDTRPFVIIQSQDLGGRDKNRIGAKDWTGLIVVRAVADLPETAEQLMMTIAPGMDALTTIPGYSINAEHEKPIEQGPDGDTFSSGHQWRVSINRS